MAFTSKAPDIEGTTSKFNEAFLKMHRIHKLQDNINMANINPLAPNEIGVYNYQIIFTNCNGLLMEAWGKLSSDEKKEVTALKQAIENFMMKNVIHHERKDMSTGHTKIEVNLHNWNVLKEWLFKYDCKIRELISRTGYDSPTMTEDDLYSL